jgi:flagellar basal body-associated protein FliL
MKKLVLILLSLLVLGGGGAAAWYFLYAKPGSEAGIADADRHAQEAARQAVFLDVGEVIVPVYSRDQESQLMVVKLQLELTDAMPPDQVRYLMPRLRDAYVGTLGTMAGRGELADESQRNAVIKHALQLASDRVLGRNVVKDVLLQRAWQQSM